VEGRQWPLSVLRGYVCLHADRPNLTMLANTLVTRIVVENM